ncbi:MAG: hypothetical protein ACI9FD_004273 [Gammaproteobacteria bacterium]|jgi:hypothetical protein
MSAYLLKGTKVLLGFDFKSRQANYVKVLVEFTSRIPQIRSNVFINLDR